MDPSFQFASTWDSVWPGLYTGLRGLKSLVLNLILLLRARPHNVAVKSEIGVFTLNTNEMFSVDTKPEKFKNSTINGHFRFKLEDKSGREISIIVKPPFSKTPSTLKRKAVVFKFLRFMERFRKFRFSYELVGR